MGKDWAIFTETDRDHWLSATRAELVLRCPCAYKFKYEDKIPTVDSVPMLMGKVFDGLVESGGSVVEPNNLDDSDIGVIWSRYNNYQEQLGVIGFKCQVPIKIDLGYSNWWVRGFVDLVPDDPNEPFREIKYAQAPWKRKKLAYNRLQMITYCHALDYRDGQWDVSNHAEPGIQTFGVDECLEKVKGERLSREKQWAKAKRQYIKAAKIIESDDREPRPNILCKGANEVNKWQCDYYDICPLRTQEQRIEVIKNEYL